ncbi:MAG: glycoside hydrolase family 32 protein [Chloroflexota bacterium]
MTIRQRASERPSPEIREPGVDHLRPCYHVMPEHGWLNDPNGLIEVDGTYHLFYQHNPSEAVWGDIHWGHASSTDLVHWRREPIALTPTPGGLDADGCWSGCAVMGPDGPVLLYTGREGGHETVLLAHGDANLRTWRKDPLNPILDAPTEPQVTDFRDPRVWYDGGAWIMVIGVGLVTGPGAVLLYRSPDLYRWELVGPIIAGDEESRGEVWECPDLFTIGGRDVLIYSVTPGEASTRYVSGAWGGQSFAVRREGLMDLGPYFYAAQTLADGPDRRLAWGWLREGRSVETQRAAGWSGVLSLPRVVSTDGEGRLLMQPVPELEALRGEVSAARDLRLEPGGVHELAADAGHAWEARIRFSSAPGARLLVTLCASADGHEETYVECDANAGKLVVDRTRSSLSVETDRDRHTLHLWDSARKEVELRIFVDGSVVEMFIDGLSITTRVYPTRRDSTAVRVAAIGGEVWLRRAEFWSLTAM